jgi:hypothetical protein
MVVDRLELSLAHTLNCREMLGPIEQERRPTDLISLRLLVPSARIAFASRKPTKRYLLTAKPTGNPKLQIIRWTYRGRRLP